MIYLVWNSLSIVELPLRPLVQQYKPWQIINYILHQSCLEGRRIGQQCLPSARTARVGGRSLMYRGEPKAAARTVQQQEQCGARTVRLREQCSYESSAVTRAVRLREQCDGKSGSENSAAASTVKAESEIQITRDA